MTISWVRRVALQGRTGWGDRQSLAAQKLGADQVPKLASRKSLTRVELQVLGRDPWKQRDLLMREVCFIADVAVLPRWSYVSQLLDYVAGVHPRFNRATAERFSCAAEGPAVPPTAITASKMANHSISAPLCLVVNTRRSECALLHQRCRLNGVQRLPILEDHRASAPDNR